MPISHYLLDAACPAPPTASFGASRCLLGGAKSGSGRQHKLDALVSYKKIGI